MENVGNSTIPMLMMKFASNNGINDIMQFSTHNFCLRIMPCLLACHLWLLFVSIMRLMQFWKRQNVKQQQKNARMENFQRNGFINKTWQSSIRISNWLKLMRARSVCSRAIKDLNLLDCSFQSENFVRCRSTRERSFAAKKMNAQNRFIQGCFYLSTATGSNNWRFAARKHWKQHTTQQNKVD